MFQPPLPLFGGVEDPEAEINMTVSNSIKASLEHFQASLTFSAIGDALGWPTEFGVYPSSVINRSDIFPLTTYVEWEKRIGGRWWGYREQIRPGSYSDDTQLSLCIARCINETGEFNPAKFAYFELPLWLIYEQGGGKSIKLAARTMLSSKNDWWRNFYRRKNGETYLEYRNAGANGAAMRVLPLALVNADNESKLARDAFLSAITTHGHPRAILSTLIYANLIAFILREQPSSSNEILKYLEHSLYSSVSPLRELDILDAWLLEWNKKPLNGKNFQDVFQDTRIEASNYLNAIPRFIDKKDNEYYHLTGANSEPFKGSGLSTVCTAIYLFLKYLDEPQNGLFSAVNQLGSDTDTIASFTGGLLGARYGLSVLPKHLLEGLQDQEYFLKVASQLHNTLTGKALTYSVPIEHFNRQEALLRVLAWEIGLHEMFWDVLTEGSRLVHPALGPGTIVRKEVKPIPREGYEVKLIEITFVCGQSCTFHSRVASNGQVSESLTTEIEQGLDSVPENFK